MAYPVSIGDFEGPLDLLLHLISTQKIDIYDISIFEVTEQYLAYIYQWQEMNLEIAGEFIVMASRLLEIKSFVLLPASSDDSETGESLKQALMEQLLAYQVFKRIGVYLKEQEEKHLGQVYREPTYFPEIEKRPCLPIEGEVLREAFTKVLAMERLKEPLKPVSAKIEREIFKIEDKIALLEKKLAFKGKEPVLFSELLTENGGKAEAIVSFQALLEYHKKGTITFKQTGLFSGNNGVSVYMKVEQPNLLVSDDLKSRLEAMLFAAGEGVSLRQLAVALQIEPEVIEKALMEMSESYRQSDRGICLICMEKKWQLATKPALFDSISALLNINQPGTLSRAALETLAIVAYRQPVTRVEIESFRGVSSSSSLQVLLDRGLIEEAGRKDAPGRPYLYKTTELFLASVGLREIADLPDFASFSDQTETVVEQEVTL